MAFNNENESGTDIDYDTDYDDEETDVHMIYNDENNTVNREILQEQPQLIRRNAEHPSYQNNPSNINANNDEDEILQQVLEQSKVEFENERKPPDNFEYFYQVQPLSHYPWHNIQHEHMEFSNKVIFPEQILKDISKLESQIFAFEVSNDNNNSSVVIPSEFIPSDTIYIPNHIYQNLNCSDNDFLKIELIQQEIEIGQYMKLQVMNSEFLQVKDIKSMLEFGIVNQYQIIKQNDTIQVQSSELGIPLQFKVMECMPSHMKLVNSDIEVDFDIPDKFLPSHQHQIPLDTDIDTDNLSNNIVEDVDDDEDVNVDEDEDVNVDEDEDVNDEDVNVDEDEEMLEENISIEEMRLARLKRFSNL